MIIRDRAAMGMRAHAAMRYVGTITRAPLVRSGYEERGAQPYTPGGRSPTLAVPTRLHIRVWR